MLSISDPPIVYSEKVKRIGFLGLKLYCRERGASAAPLRTAFGAGGRRRQVRRLNRHCIISNAYGKAFNQALRARLEIGALVRAVANPSCTHFVPHGACSRGRHSSSGSARRVTRVRQPATATDGRPERGAGMRIKPEVGALLWLSTRMQSRWRADGLTEDQSAGIEYGEADSLQFFRDWYADGGPKIDLLYLDGLDYFDRAATLDLQDRHSRPENRSTPPKGSDEYAFVQIRHRTASR